MRRLTLKTGCLGLVALLAALVVLFIGFIALQGGRTPAGDPVYVPLGSSFAAGAGLGDLQDGSPLMCARSVNGYPQQLARLRGLSTVDMTCGGAVTRNVLEGGQFFQGPQIRTITPETRLVTLTVGGNDVTYIGDLSMLAARQTPTILGWFARHVWDGVRPVDERDWATLSDELGATLSAIRERAPDAVVVVATYPTLLPASGACDAIAMTAEDADLMRAVGDRLAQVTRTAAEAGGALVVDMHSLGVGHDACSDDPWVTGWIDAGPAPFHPNAEGARATARAIAAALDAA